MMEAFDVGGTVNTADDGDEHHDDDQQHQTHHNNSKAAHEITPFIFLLWLGNYQRKYSSSHPGAEPSNRPP